MRAMSRLSSRSFMLWRLSYSFLPLARPITSLARPRSLIKSFSGTMVKPASLPSFVEAVEFFAVQQQFAIASGGVVVVRAVEIFGYVHVLDPQLAVVHIAECIGQTGFAQSD